uniref:Sugar transporter SWEET n=1 Tax=Globodera rostochiensis TaxID=31243 RepID=A0A914HZ53_GLORO
MFESFPLIPANCSATFIKAPANFDLHIQIYKLPYDLLEVQIEQNFTFAVRNHENEAGGFVRALMIVNFVTTVAMFFCGIGICRQIWKRGDTVDIKPYSFLVGLLGSCYWFVYGVLMQQPLIQYVNVCQFVIYSAYIAFYWTMSRKRCLITSQTVGVFSLVALLFALLPFLGCSVVTPFWRTNPLGVVCAFLNVASFAAPLTMLKALARAGNTSVLPLPLCLGNLLVSAEWCLFGVLISDLCIVVPNTLGILLSSSQLLLFLVLPRKSKQRAPIVQFCDGIKGLFRRRVFCCASVAVTGQSFLARK